MKGSREFRATFEGAALGMVHSHLDGRILRANERFCNILGYAQEELSRLSWYEITHPEDLERDLHNAHLLWNGQIKIYTTEKRYFRKDGAVIWVRLTGSLYRDHKGEPAYFITTVEDISDRKQAEETIKKAKDELELRVKKRTFELEEANEELRNQILERKRAEKALRQSENRYRSLLEQLPDIVYEVDNAGRITFVSSAVESILGYTPGEVLGRPWRDLILKEDSSSFDGPGVDPKEGNLCLRHLTKTGEICWLSINSRVLFDPRKRSSNYLGVARDVTANILAEDKVRHLSRELMHAQEEERRRLAFDLHDEIGQLLSTLRIGLHSLAEGLPQTWTEKKEDFQRLLDISQEVMEHIRRMAYELSPAILDSLGLGPAIQDLCEWVSDSSEIEVTTSGLGCDESQISKDVKTTLFRFVQEALTNVIRHSGSPMVGVVLNHENGYLRVSVKDHGKGFDVDQVLGGALRERRLGLVGMIDRIRLCGGQLRISSSDQGTTLSAEVPLGGNT